MGKEIIICPCGKSFSAYKSLHRKYCSKECKANFSTSSTRFKNKNRSIIITCPCGKEFKTFISHNRKYCSVKCYYDELKNKPIAHLKGLVRTKNPKNFIIKICPCGKEFESYKSHNRKYCNTKCRSKYRIVDWKNPEKSIEKECEICNKKFISLKTSHRRFCCIECKNIYISQEYRGKNHHCWKENKKRNLFKSTIEWKEWREEVFKRDNYTCQYCNIKGNCLEPHHLKSKQCFPELVYNVDNGITLCKKHHRLLHRLKPANDTVKIKEYPLSILLKTTEE